VYLSYVHYFYTSFTFTFFEILEVCFDANSKAQINQYTGGANKIKHVSIKYSGCLLLEKIFVSILSYSKRRPLILKRRENKDTSKFNSRRF
jgi:hypothetical protein